MKLLGLPATEPVQRGPLRLLFGGEKRSNPSDRSLPKWTAPPARDTFVYQVPSKGKPPVKTTVESLINGGQIFSKIDNLMNRASSSVLLNLYNLQNPDLYPEKSSEKGIPGANLQAGVVDKLISLKEKGLKVKVILDNHWDSQMGENHNQRTIDHLRANGIEVLTYPGFAKISHVKLMIVDDRFAVIGGMNWGNHSPSNHDAAVFIEGPDVRNLYNQVFKTDWETSGGDVTVLPDVEPFEEGKIKVLTTSPKDSVDGGSDAIYREIITQIGKAQQSIYAQLFVLTQSDIVDNLIFAHKRLKKAGKEGVKIMVDPGLYFSFPNTRKGVQKLARAGVPIRFYKANREIDEKLHAKWALFDKQTLMIGSANWSNVGLLCNNPSQPPVEQPNGAEVPLRKQSGANHEANVLIESKALAKPFVDQFWFDWRNRTFPILVKASDGSGRWQRLVPDSASA